MPSWKFISCIIFALLMKTCLVWERESGERILSCVSSFPQLLSRSGGEQFRSWSWPTNTLAPCVSSHFHVPAHLPLISWLIQVRSRTSVHNATKFSVKLQIWVLTYWHMLKWSCTNVHNAKRLSVNLPIWKVTWSVTVEWNRIVVHNVKNHSV